MASVTWATFNNYQVIKMQADTAPCQLAFPLPYASPQCCRKMAFTCFFNQGTVSGQNFYLYYGFVSGSDQWPGDSSTRLFVGERIRFYWYSSSPLKWTANNDYIIRRVGTTDTTIGSNSVTRQYAAVNGNDTRSRWLSFAIAPYDFTTYQTDYKIKYKMYAHLTPNIDPWTNRDLSNFERRVMMLAYEVEGSTNVPWSHGYSSADNYLSSMEHDYGVLDHLYIGILNPGGTWYPVTMYIRSIGFEVEKISGYLFADGT